MKKSLKLVIVESPTKANTIGKFLGEGYKVESSYGHVRDLPRSRFGIDLENNFEPTYIIPVKAKKRVSELRKVASKASEIILASDEDREGEAIAWHLQQVLEGKGSKTKRDAVSVIEGKPIKRIVFHEITEHAIAHALENPRALDIKMVDAQQARRILDRLVGYKLSPFLWKKIAKGLSAGRVQSVALRLIVDRENEIRAFKPQEYWSVDVTLAKKTGKETFGAGLAKINGEAFDKFAVKSVAEADGIVSSLKKAEYVITSATSKEVQKNPLPPFTTSTLQQTASSRLGYSAKKTMMMAQRLYENGLITYMRTDSVNLSTQSVAMAQSWLTTNLGAKYALPSARVFKGKSKGAQEAHEAIRPTKPLAPEQIPAEEEAERKVYRLIWQRFIASQMPEAVFSATSVEIEATDSSKKYLLRANGNTMVFDGFLKVYPTSFEETTLPKLTDGEELNLKEVKPSQHFTEPPPRFSEARLIKTLEEYGIGRPSTYVPIISVIQARNYVRKEAGKFTPTDIGEMVNKMLTENFPQIVDVNFTAKIEEKLDAVAEGTEEWHQLLKEFYVPFAKNLEEKYLSIDKDAGIQDEKTDQICDCKGKTNLPTSKCEHEGPCGKPMIIKFGRFGKFLACSGFPDCKNVKSIIKPESRLGIKCPKCSEGDVLEKHTNKGRRRVFWGCSRYPDCDWASWKNPIEPDKKKEEAEEAKEKETEE